MSKLAQLNFIPRPDTNMRGGGFRGGRGGRGRGRGRGEQKLHCVLINSVILEFPCDFR